MNVKSRLKSIIILLTVLAGVLIVSIFTEASPWNANAKSADRKLFSVNGKGQVEYTTVKAYNEYESFLNGYEIYEDITGVSVSLSPDSELYYNKVIDLKKLTKTVPIVTFNINPKTVGEMDFRRLNFKLTDIYNPDVYITLRVKDRESGDGEYLSYSGVSINGEDNICTYNNKHGSNYVWGPSIVISFGGRTGCSAKNKPVENRNTLREKDVASFYFDYDNNIVNQTCSNQPVPVFLCDLAAANNFGGFTTGEVSLSIYADKYIGNEARFILRDVAGEDFGNVDENFDDTVNEGPIIVINESEKVEKGLIDYRFPIAEAKAYDVHDGLLPVKTAVYKNYYSETRISIEIQDNCFTPKSKGIYTVCYTSENAFGVISEKLVHITVDTVGEDKITLSSTEKVTSGKQGDIISLPTWSAIGGIGKINGVTTVKFGEENIEIKDNAFQPLYRGSYIVTYTATDFVGQSESDFYEIVIDSNADLVVIEESLDNFRKNFLTNYEYTFDNAKAYVFSDAGYDIVEVKTFIDDEEIIANKFTFRHVGDYSVKFKYNDEFIKDKNGDDFSFVLEVYSVYAQDGTTTKLDLKNVFVYDTDKVTSEYKVVVDDGVTIYRDCRYIVSGDTTISYINPLPSEPFSFNFNTNANHNKIGKIRFTLTDTKNSDQKIVFAIRKIDNSIFLELSENGRLISLPLSFDGSDSSVIKIGFRGTTGEISVAGKTETVLKYINGKSYSGFDSKLVYMTVSFDGVNEEVPFWFDVSSICGQSVNGTLTKDSIKPIIMLFGDNGGVKSLNSVFALPEAISVDVISPIINKFSVTVTKPDGTYAVSTSGVSLNKAKVDQYSIILDCYGRYNFEYECYDSVYGKTNGNRQTANFSVYVYELEPPTVKLAENKTVSVKLNEKVKLAYVECSDNSSSKDEITVEYFVLKPNGIIDMVVDEQNKAVNEYTFTMQGKHTVYVYVTDKITANLSKGSLTIVSYEIEVK